MPNRTTTSSPRYPGFDGLRGVAILAVIAAHAVQPGAGYVPVRFGQLGVDLFFCLSGVLITGILLDARGAVGYFRAFYARRALRILPLYYGVVALLVLLQPALPVSLGDPAPDAVAGMQWWYWLHLTNWWIVQHPHTHLPENTAPFWSLAVEEQFYVIWPWLVWRLKPRHLLRLCAWLAVAALAWRVGTTWSGLSLRASRAATPGVMDALALGGALAVLWRMPQARRSIEAWAHRVFVFASGLALCLAAAWDGPVFPSRAPLFFSITAIGAAALLAVTLTSTGKWRLALDRGLLPAIGRVSYAMYVFHYFILAALLHAGWRSSIALVVGVAAAAYGMSLVSWWLIEQRVLSLKRFVPMPRSANGMGLGVRVEHSERQPV